MTRVHNFSAGPAALPQPVLEKAQSQLLDIAGTGRSIMEMSHRSALYSEVDHQAKVRLRDLLGLGSEFEIMFLQGGASSQFMMLPMNFLEEEHTAGYLDTGRWSAKAITEARRFGQVDVLFSSEDDAYRRVPEAGTFEVDPQWTYLHYTSNNTVAGTQFPYEPHAGEVPLACDASSDLLSRAITPDTYGLIYAGAQKNVGPAGVTIVIIRRDFLERSRVSGEIPTILRYRTHAEKIFNTPPVFNVYMVGLVLEWLQEQGGVAHFEELSHRKAGLIYEEIDRDGFYEGAVEAGSRSLMNVTFRLADRALEERFLEEASEEKLMGLKGHRSVGGVRASLYNAVPLASAEALAQFMRSFREQYG
ncbi:MAG: 3-phosphoserine/phosphohydroxythreonine transaminase [Balneolaceae bacterium]|nr:3-phosphoserine/phosphohydroxythreonine transaminase [Balneolaceae bacterium]